MSLVRVSRQLVPYDHQQLRTHIPESNKLGDLSIKWRRLGEAAVTFIERGQYEQALHLPGGRLRSVSPTDMAARINANIARSPTLNTRRKAEVINVKFLGNGPYVSIAYMLDQENLYEERSIFTNLLDKHNGLPNDWGVFEPHISIATVPQANQSDKILDTFWDFSSEFIKLEQAVAVDV